MINKLRHWWSLSGNYIQHQITLWRDAGFHSPLWGSIVQFLEEAPKQPKRIHDDRKVEKWQGLTWSTNIPTLYHCQA